MKWRMILGRKKEEKPMVYCSLRKCPHTECLRHNCNIPYDVVILRDKFKPDKEWNCKDMIM